MTFRFLKNYLPLLLLVLLLSCNGENNESKLNAYDWNTPEETTEEDSLLSDYNDPIVHTPEHLIDQQKELIYDDLAHLNNNLQNQLTIEELNRYLILFKAGSDEPNKLITQLHGVVMNEAESIEMVSAYLSDEAVQQLEVHPDVTSIELDPVVEAETSNWGYEKIRASRPQQGGITGKDINIAVIDSGISPHPSLSIAGGTSFVNYTDSYHDDNGHGTHVAGIIAAKQTDNGFMGVAPGANIFAIKSLHASGSGFLSETIAAIDWAIQNNMDIINLSLGMDRPSIALKNIVDKAYANNIVIVAAAGNNGTVSGAGDTVLYPAKYPSAIAVAAIDQHSRRANFSATGPAVEISAPGTQIFSTTLNNTFTFANGTSAAAPYVTGVVALIKEQHRRWSNKEIRQFLHETAVDLGVTGRDNWFGFGLVQAPTLLSFIDVERHWARSEIYNVAELGWMRGTSKDRFSPEMPLTRAQGAVILVRALGLDVKNNASSPFKDIQHWARQEIEIIHQHQLMLGTSNTTFSPDMVMTREQMATVLARALGITRTRTMTNPFRDVTEGSWAADAIIACAHHGIIRGISPTQFGGKQQLTRAQMAALMDRINTEGHLN